MPMSHYYAGLRQKLGNELLLIPAVAAVIHDAEGRILIQERASDGYSLPAGAIEPGEHPAQAIVREVFEETGLVVRPTILLGIFGGADGYRVRYKNGDSVEYLVCLFECEIISGDLRCLDGESASVRFYAPDDAPPLGTDYPRRLFVPGTKATSFHWDDQWLQVRYRDTP